MGHDPVNPGHYKGDTVMRIIEQFGLGFCLGNVVKYVLREKEKAGTEDLKKAAWYLNREIQQREPGSEAQAVQGDELRMVAEDFDLRPIEVPECDDCDQKATQVLWVDIRVVGTSCGVGHYCDQCAAKRLAEAKEAVG